MKERDLKGLRKSIKRADLLFLLELIIVILLFIFKIAKTSHIIGFLLGYAALKFVYERMYRKYLKQEVKVANNIFVNLFTYTIAFVIATFISIDSLLSAGFVIVTYRAFLLYNFKNLSSY